MMYFIYGLAALYTFLFWRFLVVPLWPWDWKGDRKGDIVLKRRRHDWEDDDPDDD